MSRIDLNGKLIAFEGVEGSGKSTQLSRVMSHLTQSNLRGFWSRFDGIAQTREPGDPSGNPGSIRNRIREILLNTPEPLAPKAELLLYAADRAQHYQEFIKPRLALNHLILCDRFIHSTFAYQHYARGLDYMDVLDSVDLALNGEMHLPHKVFLFDLDPEIALKRAKNRGNLDRFESLGLEFHQKVREGYLQLAKKRPSRFIIIPGHLEPDQVFQIVWEKLEGVIQEWSENPES